MADPSAATSGKTLLEVISPDGSRWFAHVTQTPYLIGRGADAGNDLALTDRRISRQCAALTLQFGSYRIEDRGHRHGIFVNGEKAENRGLQDGDVITFGMEDSYRIVFRSSEAEQAIQSMMTRIGSISDTSSSSGGLGKLNLLLEATSLLHSQLPLDSVLSTMLDHAVSITEADRGVLLEPDDSGTLRVRLARGGGAVALPIESVTPSQTALRQAIAQHASIITEDLSLADIDLQSAQSIMMQRLRSVVAIPLHAMPRANTQQSIMQRGQFLGMLYLDSRRPAAFSKLERRILDALGVEAASILDNARLVERERQRQRLEQELSIARNIQQALLPSGFSDFPNLEVSGINLPCHECGGDYFDVFPISEDRTAILIADVSGKGLGAALLTTMLQGALSSLAIGTEPALVIGHLNRFLCSHAEVGRYATLFFGIFDRNGNLEYIKAGHPSPLLLSGSEVKELAPGGSFPVGLLPMADYATAHAKLKPNDTLVMFSDGVTEAADPSEEMYGENRLAEILTGYQGEPLAAIQKTILDSVEMFVRDAHQADDITLLLVRYSPGATSQ